ncbi:MAG: ribosome biogenesis/translation initiation ATPase RLI [Candidatus Anstonellales archaeon]
MIRIAVVDRTLCTRERCGYQCMKACPINRMGKACIEKDESGFPTISENLCIGCGICPKKCPVDAITIINLVNEEGVPVYQYGPNSFRIYSLPLPKEGICSFVGRNGLGKTTALKLLTGQLKVQNPPKKEVEYFIEKRAKSSIKPQNIEAMREYDLTVRQLLQEYSKEIDEVVRKMKLEAVLDRKLNVLSGGELQRAAIATAMLNESSIYYFDEISNFQDMEERLNSAIQIREFAEGKMVVAVEHDLAVLDYLTDYVYIFYGEPKAYAFVSGAKGKGEGINQYMNGFLKEENIKFREPLNIEPPLSGSLASKQKIAEYPDGRLNAGEFSLTWKGGAIMGSEIIGIVGKNGLGKSLFVDNLAKTLDKKVAYKKQYPDRFPGTVNELFKGKDEKEVNAAFKLLGLERIREAEIANLSGGEMQLVDIARVMTDKADIYILDEPTAYLDIENRLTVSKSIRRIVENSENKAVVVVDHDIVFLNSISSRAIRFYGIPGEEGHCTAPQEPKEAINDFLKSINVTIRKDFETKRPKVNKPGSTIDKKQREEGRYFA